MKQINKFLISSVVALSLFGLLSFAKVEASTELVDGTTRTNVAGGVDVTENNYTNVTNPLITGMGGNPCVGLACFGSTTNFGQTQIENTRTGFSVTASLNKATKDAYAPGERIDLSAVAAYPTCGNMTSNVSILAQVYDPVKTKTYDSKVVINENLKGGYAIIGSASFGGNEQSAYAYAPTVPGDYIMKLYITHQDTLTPVSMLNTTGSSTTYGAVYSEMDIPFSVMPACGDLSNYVKCADENGTCTFPGSTNVAYGSLGSSCVFKDATDSIACTNDAFGIDPMPDVAKTCYYKVAAPVVNACDTPCSGTYTLQNGNVAPHLIPQSFNYSCDPNSSGGSGYMATVTMNGNIFSPGDEIIIKGTEPVGGFMTNGCKSASVVVKGPNDTSYSSILHVPTDTLKFTAPQKPGLYSIKFGTPGAVEAYSTMGVGGGETIVYRYEDSFTYTVLSPSTNSCAGLSTLAQCSTQSTCSWNSACEVPTVSVEVNGSKNPNPVEKNKSVQVTWATTGNVVSCQCTALDKKGNKISDCGQGFGTLVKSTPYPISIDQYTTFKVSCTDENGNIIQPTQPKTPSNYYFKLQHCTSSNVFQTGPFPSGTYETGNVLAGALNDGTYDYRVIDSSVSPFPSVPFISGTTNTGGNVCRK